MLHDEQSSPSKETAADALWMEHGWGLDGWQVAMLVMPVAIGCAILRLLGF